MELKLPNQIIKLIQLWQYILKNYKRKQTICSRLVMANDSQSHFNYNPLRHLIQSFSISFSSISIMTCIINDVSKCCFCVSTSHLTFCNSWSVQYMFLFLTLSRWKYEVVCELTKSGTVWGADWVPAGFKLSP